MSLWIRQHACRRALRPLNSWSKHASRGVSSTKHNGQASIVNELTTKPRIFPVESKWKNTSTSGAGIDAYNNPVSNATAGIAAAQIPSKHVLINVEGHQHAFHPLLLRDLCGCTRCLDTSTKQKTFATAEIPIEIQAHKVDVGPNSIRIEWKNDIPSVGEGHVTELSVSSLKKLVQYGSMSHRRKIPQRALWTSQSFLNDTSDIDFKAYMEDDSVLLEAIRQLHTHGLLFITNIPGNEKSVEAIGERIGPLKTTFYGKVWDVKSVPQPKNVAYTSEYLGFHKDIMYLEQPPHVQLLHCIRSSAKGGASLFTDSHKAANEIGKEDLGAWQALSQLPIDYHYNHPGEHYYHQARAVVEQKPIQIGQQLIYSWEQYQQGKETMDWPDLSPVDFIKDMTWSPPFQAPFSFLGQSSIDCMDVSDSSNIISMNHKMEQWHAAAKKFNDLIHSPQNIHERPMKPGECVIFDNRRVLHARRAFEAGDANTERWLRGAYVDKDPYMSRMKVLTDQEQSGGSTA